MAVSTVGVLGGFIGFTFLRVAVFAPARWGFLALAEGFLGFDLAMIRFAAFPRADLEVLRALSRCRFSSPCCRSLLPLSHDRHLLPLDT
jgi:hypothetical protein